MLVICVVHLRIILNVKHFRVDTKKDVPLPFVQCLYVESTDEPLQNIQGALHHIFRYDYLFSAMLTSKKNDLPLWQSFQPRHVYLLNASNIRIYLLASKDFGKIILRKRKSPSRGGADVNWNV